MDLFDLHADTPYKWYASGHQALHISPDAIPAFDRYAQVFAFWADDMLDDEAAWDKILDTHRHFIHSSLFSRPTISLLSLEDARVLACDIRRLHHIASLGFRILTLQWRGKSCIGGGYDTAAPLSAFGKQVVLDCGSLHIIPDVAHASHEVLNETAKLCHVHDIPLICSHANSFSVCPHRRNLTDEDILTLLHAGCLFGLSLVPQHLAFSGHASAYDLVKHIDHFLSLGCENAIALGTDFDGVDVLPENIHGISSIPNMYHLVSSTFGDTIAHKFFWQNAALFFRKNGVNI